jgi:hypothetical protein
MAYGSAKHSRKKIERLIHGKPISAPWLSRVSTKHHGLGHKFGQMHFAIYRNMEQPIGPGTMHLSKKRPYMAKVCIGTHGRQKDRVAGRLDSKFTTQKGDTMGCEWGGGKTPTRALGDALKSLGRRLGKVKRGR